MIEYLISPEESREAEEEKLRTSIDSELRQFFKMFKSYNPAHAMGQGMAAEFYMRRSSLEYKIQRLLDSKT